MRGVVVFGVFDLIHPGHLYFLKQAKKYGEHLTVVVTRDARAIAEKRRKPIFNGRERLQIVRAIKWVDYAILGDGVGEWRVLDRLRPNVVCVGYDQKAEWIKKCGLKKMPRIVRIRMYKKYSSRTLHK